MKFEEILKTKQLELEMNNSNFAKYIGLHRTWLVSKYSKTAIQRPLSIETIGKLNNRLGIPISVMYEYNDSLGVN